jgi:dipeptidyl aminopeptidase/acylaminoacyl peptidase
MTPMAARGILAIALLLSAPVPSGAIESESVTFAARDGVQVSGTLVLPDRLPAPAVVLLHMLGRTHHDWDVTAQKLAEAGMASLAIDFRRAGVPPADVRGGEGIDLVADAEAARA